MRRRCAVVVDSRNVVGQARRLFGRDHKPTCPGIVDALASYGLDVVQIHIGIATSGQSGRHSERYDKALSNNRAYAKTITDARATVLPGTLVERKSGRGDKVMEEKQVDVLLAVAICELAADIDRARANPPFDCIVVLSDDMDLMPVYAAASRLGVLSVAAAADKVFARPTQQHWLALTEQAVSTLCAVQPAGIDHRRYVATLAMNGAGQATNWRTPPWSDVHDVVLHNNREAAGIWPHHANLTPKKKYLLGPIGMQPIGARREGVQFILGKDPAPGPLPGITPARVERWISQTTVKARLPSGLAITLDIPPCHLPAGTQIVVLNYEGSHYYVGPLNPTPSQDPVAVQITALATATTPWHRAIDSVQNCYAVSSKICDHVGVGDTLHVLPTGASATGIGGLPVAMALTCC